MSRIEAWTPKVTTLAERKRFEAARLTSAADAMVRDLRLYAEAQGGRFVVFGSYIGDAMRFDSDLDVLVDFPADLAAAAWTFAEDRALFHGIPLDIHDAGVSKPAFVETVMRTGLKLS